MYPGLVWGKQWYRVSVYEAHGPGWLMALRDVRQEVDEEVMEVEEEEEVRTLPVVGPWLMTEPRFTSAAGDIGGVIRGQLT